MVSGYWIAGGVGGVGLWFLCVAAACSLCSVILWMTSLFFCRKLGPLLNTLLQSIPEKLLCLHNAERAPMSIQVRNTAPGK